jgi:hypothetical protein|tara:strand:+ start:391 stop:588 length:198 start_codon:yes stop_codon:yes gene_type:complete
VEIQRRQGLEVLEVQEQILVHFFQEHLTVEFTPVVVAVVDQQVEPEEQVVEQPQLLDLSQEEMLQ